MKQKKFKLKYILTTLLSLGLCSFSYAKPEQCEDLVEYNKTQLESDFTKANKNLTVSIDSMKTLKSLQQEIKLLNKKTVNKNDIFSVLTKVSEANKKIAQEFKINLESGLLKEPLVNSQNWFNKVIKDSEDAEVLDSIAQSRIENHFFGQAVENLDSLGKAIKSLNEFTTQNALNKNKHLEAKKDNQKLISGLKKEFNSLEKEVEKINIKVHKQTNIFNTIDTFKKEIDKNCK